MTQRLKIRQYSLGHKVSVNKCGKEFTNFALLNKVKQASEYEIKKTFGKVHLVGLD